MEKLIQTIISLIVATVIFLDLKNSEVVVLNGLAFTVGILSFAIILGIYMIFSTLEDIRDKDTKWYT